MGRPCRLALGSLQGMLEASGFAHMCSACLACTMLTPHGTHVGSLYLCATAVAVSARAYAPVLYQPGTMGYTAGVVASIMGGCALTQQLVFILHGLLNFGQWDRWWCVRGDLGTSWCTGAPWVAWQGCRNVGSRGAFDCACLKYVCLEGPGVAHAWQCACAGVCFS